MVAGKQRETAFTLHDEVEVHVCLKTLELVLILRVKIYLAKVCTRLLIEVHTKEGLVVDTCIIGRARMPQEQVLHRNPSLALGILRYHRIGDVFLRLRIDKGITIPDSRDPHLFIECQG